MRADVGHRWPECGSSPARLVLGLLLMALGVIFLGDNLGYFDARHAFFVFWPSAFVVVGVAVLLGGRRRRSSRFWGLLWIVAGGWIWAYQRAWIRVDFWDLFVPGIFVFFGGMLIYRAFVGPRSRWRSDAERDPNAEIRGFAVLSGNEIRSAASAFRSAELGAVMGGVMLDLTQAKMAAEVAAIDLFALWGGIEIRVPREWAVVSHVTPLMAGFEDKTEPTATGPSHRLVLSGLVVMGGVEISN